ncbi:MAG TPA: IucA/IucC family protein [Pseudonocardiaceae bacterium]|nr:IucA/IucC family protein [Pseudonocardiaceae bacterium]
MPSSTIGLDTRRPATVSADHVVAHTLFNCFIREVAGPERQVTLIDDELRLRLPRLDVTLRITVRRRSMAGAHRFTGPVFEESGGTWCELHWRDLAERLADELTLATGVINEEFLDQVAASHDVTEQSLRHKANNGDRYLVSEQSLALGHRFHPTPKSRSGHAGRWQTYAPELGCRLRLRYLAARADLVRQQTVPGDDLTMLDGLRPVPTGYRLLPVHPWQFELLRHNNTLAAALRDGRLLDLGTDGPLWTPTSSVRTLHGPGGFLKFSLNVRITNCVRKNSAYELAAAVALTGLLDDLPIRMLREPGYRTVDLADRELFESLGIIAREGVARHLRPGVTALLAGAVADEYPLSRAHVSHLVGDASTDRVLDWWRAYLRLLLPPVLAAFFEHGVVLEPHLQNVLVGVDGDGMPAQMLFRDMEGTKLLAERHAVLLASLPPEVAGPMTYTVAKGWQRVAYCLLVNHVAELLAALADLRPDLEAELWSLVRAELAAYHGAPPELRAILAGVPVPAKANLLARWQRGSDRQAGYVPLRLPL